MKGLCSPALLMLIISKWNLHNNLSFQTAGPTNQAATLLFKLCSASIRDGNLVVSFGAP